jgi:long-chain acyl-CoA synthetase
VKNRQYALYELPEITDLKDLVWKKNSQIPEKTAFAYAKGRDEIVNKSYHEFWNDVNALGTWEYACGFKDAHIGIIGENSYEWLLAFFSIVNGGNVAVTIDKALPPKEIMKLLYKADVTVVFCSQAYMEVFDGMDDIDVISMSKLQDYIDEGNRQIAGKNMSYIDYVIDRKKMCCIMFTSGTSGESKGVMLSHENIAGDINGSCQLFKLDGNTMAVLPFHHAFGLVVGVLMVFNYGHTTYISKSLKRIRNDIQTAKPQTMFLVPLFVETFSRQIWDNARKNGKEKTLKIMMKISDFLLKLGIDIRGICFKSVQQAFGGNLRYIISGGAKLNVQYIKEFRSWGIEILNGYGTTECSPCVAVNRNFYHKDGTVGLPLPNVKVKINEEGEVLIKGTPVMLGYYKDEKSTSETLNTGWYSTGDIGFLDNDGFITLTGRKKNLIILSNGENISPEELETDLLQDMAVHEAVVYELGNVIVAEVYPIEEYLHDNEYFENLRKSVNKKRPIYKQISKIILRDDEFPKNTSGKILRYHNK